MVKLNYGLENLLSDIKFSKAVESSKAFSYLSSNFDNSYVFDEKKRLLKLKGYSNLKTREGFTSIERCSNPSISLSLKKTYMQAKKNIAEYQERAAEKHDEFTKRWNDARKAPQTREQVLAAMDGGWYFLKQEDPVEFKRCMDNLYG